MKCVVSISFESLIYTGQKQISLFSYFTYLYGFFGWVTSFQNRKQESPLFSDHPSPNLPFLKFKSFTYKFLKLWNPEL